MNTRVSKLLLGLTLVAPATAVAQAMPPATDFGGSALQVILSLVVVLALLLGSLYFLKRLSAPRGGAAGLLRVVSAIAVGARERVVVVEIADTWLILGVAQSGISALHQMPRQALATVDEAALSGRDFSSWLKQVMDRRNAR